ncbi:MAG: SMP-30/gluconolactonase/LRE family protein, partial [Gammaproteobacteria bacterium]|nr:SMP-30/gluconolactonase/LRE family protein [Gammaproteobacteria bacterium]
VWVAAGSGGVLRVADGGEVLDRVEVTENTPVACMLGGPDRKTLYIPTTIIAGPEELARERKSKIETVEVDVPGAGWPA